MKKTIAALVLAVMAAPASAYTWSLETDFRQPKYKQSGQVKSYHVKRGVGKATYGGGSISRFHYRATRPHRAATKSKGGKSSGAQIIKKQ